MAVQNAAQAIVRTVGDPCAQYESLKPVWDRCRAVCSGERFVKDMDAFVDTNTFSNILIPFSPSMSQKQYNFYKAEAELPGITANYKKLVIGGLLRKSPQLELPEGGPEGVKDWILNEFGKDDSSLTAFLDEALSEELDTSRSWVFVDYPKIPEEIAAMMTKEELQKFKPYPVIRRASEVINWRTRQTILGKTILDRIIVRGLEESYDKNEFHPEFLDTVWVHELDDLGYYRVRKFQVRAPSNNVPVIAGERKQSMSGSPVFEEVELSEDIMINGERLTFIPAWPLSGCIEPVQPTLAAIVDKEVALYNKMSRRNHLLYGASTYTPYIATDMADDEFQSIVDSGLGTWLKLRQGDSIGVLETPTAALADMDRAITSAIEEMAKLGIRMLSPEVDQSGVALELRNAAQTAQLGSLNNRVSHTMRQVIAFMINWRYGSQLRAADVDFSLSADFNPTPLGEGWLRLATEWYQQGLIPRSIWLLLLRHNDMLPPDYDDDEGRAEITEDLDAAEERANESAAAAAEAQGYADKVQPKE